MKISNEFKIGIATIAAISVLIFGINFLKGINMFKTGSFYYIVCSQVNGLAVSSHVELNGYQVGLVRNMEYDYNKPGHIIVEINVNKDLRIPADSRATVQTDMLGTSIIVLELGQSDRLYADRDTIAGGNKASNMLDDMKPMMPTVAAMLPKVDSILTGLNIIVNRSDLHESLLSIRQLTAQLNQSTTQLNRLLHDDVPTILNHVTTATANFDTISTQIKAAELHRTLADAQTALDRVTEVLQKLDRDDNSAGQLLNTTELHDQLLHTIVSADSLISDIRQNPKRYINVSVFGDKKK